MSGLQLVEHDGPPRCVVCGAEAVGPCRRCDAMVCGDCCVLTEGGADVHAICVRCDRRGGRDLGVGYRALARSLLLGFLALVAFVVAMIWLTRGGR